MAPSTRDAAWAFLLTAAATALVLVPFVTIYDADSYLHIALAARYAEGHLRGGLEWARLSAMADGFGDKELLFHLLLAPFAALSRSTLSGKLAIVLLNGAVAATLASLLSPYLGRASRFAHLAICVTTLDYSSRVLRLRPELLSLLLVLIGLSLAARARYRSLGLLAYAFTLAYSGWEVLPVLVAAFFGWELFSRRQRPWPLILWPSLGVGLGVVTHPQFPSNVRIWMLQNVLRYLVPLPDAGEEMQAGLSGQGLFLDAGLALALLALWLSATPAETPRDEAAARFRAYTLLALAFFTCAFFALPARFGLYVAPLATLAVACELAKRGLRPSIRHLRGRRLPVVLALVPALGLGAHSLSVLRGAVTAALCFDAARESQGRHFGSVMPPGARVAASWQESENYAYWAPQASYPNVLDPVFMAIPKPAAYRASLSVFAGSAPDVPLLVQHTLSSDLLAFHSSRDELYRRTAADPRLRVLHKGQDMLFALVPGGNRAFFLDWRVAPEGEDPAAVSSADIAGWQAYPRFGDPQAEAIEGFVDLSRLPPVGRCRVLARVFPTAMPTRARWELSSWGPSSLWLDGRPVVRLLAGSRAVLGEGAQVEFALAPGAHTLVVETCPQEGVGGFYLVER